MTHPQAAPTQVIGIDLGDRFSYMHILEMQTGERLGETKLPTRPENIEAYFRTAPPSRVVVEAGLHSRWVSEVVEKLGHQVIVANPNTVALIHRSHKKNDAEDAQKLARLARLDPDLLSPIKHRSQQTQTDRSKLKARSVLISARTQLINYVRGLVKSFGNNLPDCSAASFHKVVPSTVPECLAATVKPLLESIAHLTQEIKTVDKELADLAKTRYPETELLRKVPGVGLLVSLAFVLTIEHPERFAKSRDVAAYLGLVPKQYQSGERDPKLGISKRGDKFLRHLLVQSAHFILGGLAPESDLRDFGLKIVARGGRGAKQQAVIAVARKLAGLLHHLWLTGEVYDPHYQSKLAQTT